MNTRTQTRFIAGPAGRIECALDLPDAPGVRPAQGLALVAHPHPLYGGTLDNKVVQTLARAFLQLGFATVRPNFRGVGESEGSHDDGKGEVEDLLAVVAALRDEFAGRFVLAGFSFGAAVASQAAARMTAPPERLVLVGPSVRTGLAGVPADTLVVHGELDDVVPLAEVLGWARTLTLPIVVVPGGGHFFHGQLPLLKQIVLRSFGASHA